MIGFLPGERLRNIPAAYRDPHELCFYLHDAMVGLLKGAEEAQTSTFSVKLESSEEATRFVEQKDPIGYFWDRGEIDIARRIALQPGHSSLVRGLPSFCFFSTTSRKLMDQPPPCPREKPTNTLFEYRVSISSNPPT
jgi:hypothetical protein